MEIIYYSHNKGSQSAIGARRNLFHALVFVKQGEAKYQVESKDRILHAGDGLLIRAGTPCARFEATDVEIYCIRFRTEKELPAELPEHCLTDEILDLLNACDGILASAETEEGYRHIALIAETILKRLSADCEQRGREELVTSIRNYIHEHICEKLTLDEICGATEFSQVYCSSLFKKRMGKSIIEYVIDEKIEEAKRLILEDVEFTEISDRLGFTEYNYFSRVFKKCTGCSPSQYRKSYTQK